MTEKELLRRLGIWPNLSGYQYMLKGFELIRENSEYLQCVTKRLYPDIGRAYKASWPSVERAIRTAVISCWDRGNRDFLDQIADYHLRDRPTVSEFFAISWMYLSQNKQGESEERQDNPSKVLKNRKDCRKSEKNLEQDRFLYR